VIMYEVPEMILCLTKSPRLDKADESIELLNSYTVFRVGVTGLVEANVVEAHVTKIFFTRHQCVLG
jgi:hypothetical protein